MDQSIFFGEEEEDENGVGRNPNRPALTSKDVREAQKICNECPVQRQCLEFAVVNEETYGIWGGLTGRDRSRMIRTYRIMKKNRTVS